jgi:arginine/ornithine N-succinyltransferase beta subunit
MAMADLHRSPSSNQKTAARGIPPESPSPGLGINAMRQSGLDQLSKLVDEDGLSDFRRRLRTSLLAYSKGTTLPDVSDRLVYTLSALEGLFLKDSSEPIQQNLGERMAFLIEREAEARQKVVQNVRAAYGMRSKYIHHRITVLEEESLELFVANARKVLYISLMSADHFNLQADFVAAIDRIKFGG